LFLLATNVVSGNWVDNVAPPSRRHFAGKMPALRGGTLCSPIF
jgi:hypothetical protein